MPKMMIDFDCANGSTQLAQRRRLIGYSQSLLAMKSGVNLRMIQQYESGARDICKASFQTIWLLSKALQCSIEDIVDIDIDVTTDCIVKRTTGEIFDTDSEIVKRTIIEAQAKNDIRHGWHFNWHEIQADGNKIIELYTKYDHRIQGRIAFREMNGYVYVANAENAPGNIGREGEYEGVGANLFALVCKISRDLGFGGVVCFLSKKDDKVMNNYIEKMHAKQVGSSQLMILDEMAADFLITKYCL